MTAFASISVQHVYLAAAWLLWCALHSLLISRFWMQRVHNMFGARTAYYRLVYVLFSVVTLPPVLIFQWRIETPLIWAWSFPWSLLQWTGLALAAIVFYLGAREYDHQFFLGFRQIRDHRADRSQEFSGFATSGILARIRHPYYSAGIVLLFFWGDLTAANLILKIIGIGYFIIGARLEEIKLVHEFGEAYRSYQGRVPMLLPRFFQRIT